MASDAPGLKAAIRLPGAFGIEWRFTFRAGNQHGCGYRRLPVGCTVAIKPRLGFETGTPTCGAKSSRPYMMPMKSKTMRALWQQWGVSVNTQITAW